MMVGDKKFISEPEKNNKQTAEQYGHKHSPDTRRKNPPLTPHCNRIFMLKCFLKSSSYNVFIELVVPL